MSFYAARAIGFLYLSGKSAIGARLGQRMHLSSSLRAFEVAHLRDSL